MNLADPTPPAGPASGAAAPDGPAGDQSWLARLGERVRTARARRGLTRRTLARESGVSERYLAELEGGRGNISVLLLRQIGRALGLPLEELVREGPETPAELALLTARLSHLDADGLAAVHAFLAERQSPPGRAGRIALIGLRGAGKSTLGQALAGRLGVPFLQLDREVEAAAGMRLAEIFDLFGQAAFRRLERRCLEEVLQRHPRFVLEAGGGLVAEPATFERLLASCRTVWLQARPDEHMDRVAAQGDLRPMAGSDEAMDDLKRILEGRTPFYRKADLQFDTSGRSVDEALAALAAALDEASPPG